jgi:hypothetical protein
MSDLAISPVGAELLDDPRASDSRVETTLRNIARSNRWFGGLAALRYGLGRVLARVPAGSSVSLLDLGTGFGDGPRAAAAWGASRGIRIVPVALERSRAAARVAAGRGLPMVVGCAGAPPFGEKSVDVVLLSQVAHHFDRRSVVELVRTCDRLARMGVVIADLRRATLGALAFWCGSRLLRFDPVTKADGITSIRRGFTERELAILLARAGVRGHVARRPGYRVVASWTPAPA